MSLDFNEDIIWEQRLPVSGKVGVVIIGGSNVLGCSLLISYESDHSLSTVQLLIMNDASISAYDLTKSAAPASS